MNYLKPAITALKGKYEGPNAGLVLHEFAFFCDKQLQNPDARTDFDRVTKAKGATKKGSRSLPDANQVCERETRSQRKTHERIQDSKTLVRD